MSEAAALHAGAGQIQTQIQALDMERERLERQHLTPPAATPAVAAAARSARDADTIRRQDMPAAVDAVVKARQKELGAKEAQAGVVPLLPLRAQDRDHITRELAGQFAAWPEAAGQAGLLDQDGNGRLDGLVDVPADGVFRLVRERSDGALGIQAFALPSVGRGAGPLQPRALGRPV